MLTTYTDKELGTVILNESLRARSISIKVSRSNQTITLTYPKGYNLQKAIEFLELKRNRIQAIQERQRSIRDQNPPASSYNLEELRKAAKEHLPQRIAHIAAKTNFKYNKLTLRATRSKWGSCSGDNNISLSIYLMILPQYLIDFVILHELCHTVHHNHSPKFHALLDYVSSGKAKQFNAELRRYSIS